MSFLQRPFWLIFIVILCTGCSAQSDSTSDLNRKIERQIRAKYSVPADINMQVGARRPSTFPGYDEIDVTFSQGTARKTDQFLLAQDGKSLLKVTRMDLQSDPYAEAMKRIDTAGRPVRGARDSKVAVVVYDDFQCPFCSRFHQTFFREVFKDYQDRVHVIYKDYPLFSIHPWAGHAANDANCLASLNNDAFWEFADEVHLNPQQITGAGPQKRGVPEQQAALDILAFDIGAKKGLDASKLQACVKAQSDRTVQQSVQEAEALGVNATPTIFINGRRMEGAVDPDELRAALNDALRDAGQPVPPPPPKQVNIVPMPQAIPAPKPAGPAPEAKK